MTETYLYVGALAILAVIVRHVIRKKCLQERPSGIVTIQHLIPWIWSPLRYATLGPRAFLLEYSRKMGPIFGFNVLGHRVVMISSLNALREIFKLERNGSFSVVDGQQMHIMVGHRASQERFDYLYASLRKNAFRHLYQAFSAQEIVQRAPHINLLIQESIQATLFSGNKCVSMTSYTRRVVYQTIMMFFFGPETPDIFQDADALDLSMPTIMYGLEKLVPSAVRCRERVYNAIAKHLSSKWVIPEDNPNGYLEGASDFLSHIIGDMNNDGFTHEERARYLIAILWGATGNLMLVCTWVMGQMTSNFDLYSKIANETRLTTDNLNSDELLEISQKTHSFPYLDALIQEVLRTKTQIPLMRVAQEDVIIVHEGQDLHIYKGDLVAPNAPTMNMDPEHFHEPQSFSPERFVDSPEGKALYVFGGGLHVCAGKHLALQIIRLVVILTLRSFDLSLNDTSDKSLRENANSFASFVRMSNDLFIDFLPRNTSKAILSQ